MIKGFPSWREIFWALVPEGYYHILHRYLQISIFMHGWPHIVETEAESLR